MMAGPSAGAGSTAFFARISSGDCNPAMASLRGGVDKEGLARPGGDDLEPIGNNPEYQAALAS
jgi:hypothetical protein